MASTTASSSDRPASPMASNSSSDSSDTPIQALDATADDGWADVSPDTENLEFKSLFDDSTFPDIHSMAQHDLETWDFDLKDHILRLGLDFYGCIRLVNYVRSQVRDGKKSVKVETSKDFEDEKYLQPVLEDDAALFGLDDLISINSQVVGNGDNQVDEYPVNSKEIDKKDQRIQGLQEELERLRKQFSDYRMAVEKTLDQRWGASDADLRNDQAPGQTTSDIAKENDEGYFNSYAFHEIHATMLKDEIRTSAYRDFMYDNKHLFADKIVLDIGCGTGILSLFAAKAGAKHVYAVDNSAIIHKAREIVAENGLQDKITCISGKVEEIVLPQKSDLSETQQRTDGATSSDQGTVDIIISEWFGYCLLYENMLESVLRARDRYISHNSSSPPLILPSHTTLHIAPLSDPEYITSNITFWHSVYGFSMTPMLKPPSTDHTDKATKPKTQPSNPANPDSSKSTTPTSIYDEVYDRIIDKSNIAAPSARFKTLNLYTATNSDLEFTSPFSLTLSQDLPDGLDGFVIWFDVFFLTSSESKGKQNGTSTDPNTQDDLLPADARGESWPGAGNEHLGVAFTTGPAGKETHWKQGCLLVNRMTAAGEMQRAPALASGQVIQGTIKYLKGRENPRELEIEIEWEVEGAEERGRQVWFVR